MKYEMKYLIQNKTNEKWNFMLLKHVNSLLFNYVKNNLCRDVIETFSVAGIYCKLLNCKVHKRNNKGKCNMPLFND